MGNHTKTLHLVCNAHLDPAWLWEWEEGLAETLSTFRTAARLCREFEEFVFCHNESLLYRWVEKHDPELFSAIQGLVKEGRWHIMGGWFLQPDCNMPSGESLVRQILSGRTYFEKKFGVLPQTAVNFDSFGHSRGLVQILNKSGYRSYVFCRPDPKKMDLPADDFIWVGYDGSEVLAHRARHHYNSERGKAGLKVKGWLSENRSQPTGLLFWGIGNHGGGASFEDLTALRAVSAGTEQRRVVHSTPEAYFEELKKDPGPDSRWEKDLNPWAVGCYTSMAKVKQGHRRLENAYFLTEKMATHATLEGLMRYPRRKLEEALEDLLFCQFHDILPGSSIREVEENALQKIGHGLEILSRLRSQAFFSLLSGQPEAGEGEFPIFVYNPHPFEATETVACEFQPLEPNPDPDVFWMPELKDERGTPVTFQLEKESSNVETDQRKRVIFRTPLQAGSMNRFTCRLRTVSGFQAGHGERISPFTFSTRSVQVSIDPETGLMTRYCVEGKDYLKGKSLRLLVCRDSSDPWGMLVRGFRTVVGFFGLMSPRRSARFSGVTSEELDPVRVIEDGPVRTVIEAVYEFESSTACLTYTLPKKGSELEIGVRVNWAEKDRMLKLSIPSAFEGGACRGQVAYGVEDFERFSEELAAQKWVAVVSADGKRALTVINEGIYGFDCSLEGELRLSLLRSPAYAGHPVGSKPIVPQDRFRPRIDTGERVFRFWVQGGEAEERLMAVGREALLKNERPVVLSCSPSGTGKKISPGILLGDASVQLSAFKLAGSGDWLIVRLFEPTGNARTTGVEIPSLGLSFEVCLAKYEIKTIACDLNTKRVFETDLLERELHE